MTNEEQGHSVLRIALISAGWLVCVIAFSLLLRQDPIGAPWLRGTALIVVFSIGFLVLPPVRRSLAGLSATQATAAAIVVGAFLAGHLSETDRKTFPLVAWHMYTDHAPDTRHFTETRVTGKTFRGTTVVINYDSVVRGLRYGVLSTLEALIEVRDQTPDASAREKIETRIHRILDTLARRYEMKHPNDPLQTISFEIDHVTIDWDARTIDVVPSTPWTQPVGEVSAP